MQGHCDTARSPLHCSAGQHRGVWAARSPCTPALNERVCMQEAGTAAERCARCMQQGSARGSGRAVPLAHLTVRKRQLLLLRLALHMRTGSRPQPCTVLRQAGHSRGLRSARWGAVMEGFRVEGLGVRVCTCCLKVVMVHVMSSGNAAKQGELAHVPTVRGLYTCAASVRRPTWNIWAMAYGSSPGAAPVPCT